MTTCLFPHPKSNAWPRTLLRYGFLLTMLLWLNGLQAQCDPDVTPPSCQPPASVTVSCDGFDPSLWNYGEAEGVDNCCMGQVSKSSNYSHFDTVCNKGTIVRTFNAFDCSGNSAQCSQTITVNYEQEYFIKFPNDVITNVLNPNGFYGEPSFFEEDCELTGISYQDEVFTLPSDSSIRLERTWIVINWCTYDPGLPFIVVPNPNPEYEPGHPSNLAGPIVSAAGTPFPWGPTVVKINPSDTNPTDYSLFYEADANGYTYKQIILITDTLLTYVTGKAFVDNDADCTYDPGEPAVEGWNVKITTDGQDFYTRTDAAGGYVQFVSSQDDSVEVTLLPPFNLAQVCPVSYTIPAMYGQATIQNLPATLNSECPLLTVDLTTPRLRRCFQNYYNVDACNLSNIAVEDASVTVHLDDYMEFMASSIPGTPLGGNTWSFQVGDLAPGECVHFYVNFMLNCSAPVGATHCSDAQIFPDTLCGENPLWSGADVRVAGRCDGDSVRLTITNAGSGAMSQVLDFVVVEDVIMFQEGSFQLNSGQTRDISLPANGATWRLQAEQEPFHPWGGPEAVAVEGCGGINETGLVNMFSVNSPNPFSTRDCQENIGSYDPNDKQAFPKGYGDEHLLEANTDLEYMIRFQNTGTDTAFTVAVLDTLSAFLNPATVRPGASSHPYSFEILDNQVLRFHFANILLPDSNVNEAASHGFLKFRVAQKPNNPNGSKIENSAAIYFDFNEAVITNTVFHHIGDHFLLTVDVDPGPAAADKLRVYPNPGSDAVFFDLPAGNGQFALRNQLGQVLRTTKITQSPFRFERGSLTSGIYFFDIQMDDQQVFTGKIILK